MIGQSSYRNSFFCRGIGPGVLKVMLFIAKKFGKMNIHDLVQMEHSELELDSLDSYVYLKPEANIPVVYKHLFI